MVLLGWVVMLLKALSQRTFRPGLEPDGGQEGVVSARERASRRSSDAHAQRGENEQQHPPAFYRPNPPHLKPLLSKVN